MRHRVPIAIAVARPERRAATFAMTRVRPVRCRTDSTPAPVYLEIESVDARPEPGASSASPASGSRMIYVRGAPAFETRHANFDATGDERRVRASTRERM
ncbi:hypothetical protein ABD05_20945 [Burkholderia pyrrocinia]|nr:hypothetical protein ABD05_20945 [Burkholderia pyrrocinia]